MSGEKFEFEYPDQAGYPDGMGTLHEGVDEDNEAGTDDRADDAATAAEHDLEEFALDDEEDVDGNV
ncbi:hypothetical protein [Agromyces humatus]|nr:hypothetical protein [Agromyces humatus]